METVLLVLTVACAVANGFIVVAKVARAPFVLGNVLEVGLSPRHVPLLAVVEGLGVVGLVVGLLGGQRVGLAAGLGLAGFFVVALLAHLRARVLHSLPFPVAFLGLALAASAYFCTV